MHTGISETSPLQQLALEARQELYDILHWWASKMPDHEHGGFYGRIDGTGLLHGQSDKSVILNTRILWTFSAAALQTGKTAYREVADRAYHYILDYFWDAQYGGVYWMLDYKGHPSQDKKQVYAQAFAMYAFSEYYRLTQDETALQKARTLFDLMERHSLDKMRGGYFEAFSRDWQLIADLRLSDKDANEAKTMNTHLHVLEAYANLLRAAPSQPVEAALKALILLFLDRFIDPQTAHLRLFFDEYWNLKSEEISFGHDIETSWLLCDAAQVLGAKSLIKRTRQAAVQVAEACLQEGTDPQNGGMYYTAHPQHGITHPQKDWWPQAEAVLGYLNAWEISGAPHFLEAAGRSWQFIIRHLRDTNQGEWYWAISPEGLPDTQNDKAGPWKCPYHNGRACMQIEYIFKRLSEH
ncbi:MAG: AGE family epimerase/isomerase [Saprospiraceae bacterium]|nr:AGE family epimerase/isomerase [Saprospiraceae bacterium]